MHNEFLLNLLYERYQKKQLGHFYLLQMRTITTQVPELLSSWVDQLITQILRHELAVTEHAKLTHHLQTHPDILRIHHNETDKDYHLDDFHCLWRFLQFNPFSLPHRFVIITDAHLISDILCNKLLKSLEGPGENISLFFINPTSTKLISTIESRAIKLSLINPSPARPSDSAQSECFKQFVDNHLSTTQLLEKVKEFPQWQSRLLQDALDHLTKKSVPYQTHQHILDSLKWFETSKTFHNWPHERFFPILEAIKTPPR